MDTLTKKTRNKEINNDDIVKIMNLVVDNKIDSVQLLLQNGLNVNLKDTEGWVALFYAVIADNPKMVELFIKYQANLEVEIQDGFTLLMCASMQGNAEITELLIKNGSKIEASTLAGKTALIFSANRGHVDVVKVLIQCGANIHKVSHIRNKSVIMYAARAGGTAVVDVLIQAGANIKLKDLDNLTALNHAVKHKHESTAYRLLSAYSLEEKDEFAIDSPENFNLLNNFDEELYKNQEKIYLILRTPYKLKVNSEKECHFSVFPVEIINLIKFLEVKLQNFPDWYQHRVEKDTSLAFNLKAPMLMTPAYDAQKRKSGYHEKQDNKFEKNTNIELNQIIRDISNL